jgi:diacylglycerol kinase
MNSAIEYVVDLASPEFHPLAKKAKDMAAGAVLLAAIGTVVIAAIIFLPKLNS